MRSIFFTYFSGYSYFENKVNEGLFKTVKGERRGGGEGDGEGMERGWRGGGEGMERGWRGGRRGGYFAEQIMLVQVIHVQFFVRIYNVTK